MKGRKPKPPAMQAVLGNPGKRRLDAPAPGVLPAADLTPPAHLSEDAARVWLDLAPRLEAVGVLTALSVHALAGFCDSYARWIAADLKAREQGEVITNRLGRQVPNPWRTVSDRAFTQWMKVAPELGLTPSALTRAGARLDAYAAYDPADRFFTGPKLR